MIYLDHNATTDIHPEVIVKMSEVANLGPLNPSSIHGPGRKARAIIEESRKSIAKLLGFEDAFRDYQVTFTSGGTEANNLILSNFSNDEIFVSATEHHSIWLHSTRSHNIKIIDVDKDGVLDLQDLKNKLNASESSRKLVSVMLANNETGVIQPIKEIANIAHEYGALIHSDIVQSVGKMPVNIVELDVDFVSISGHKFGAPMGVGALIGKVGADLEPMIIGGGQEKSLRAGTENVFGIAGLGFASLVSIRELNERIDHMKKLRDKLEIGLLRDKKNVKIAGREVDRLPNTSLIINKSKTAQTQIIAFDLKGVAVSSGSACSSGRIGASHVLVSMDYLQEEIRSAIRVSVGANNTEDDIDYFLKIYNEVK